MDVYEQEIYKFLTQKEHFENMVKVLEHSEMIRRNLIIEFWTLVREKLEDLKQENKQDWIIIKPQGEEIFDRWSRLCMTKKNWDYGDVRPLFYIAWESLSEDIHYGLKMEFDKEKHNVGQVEKQLRAVREKTKMKGNKHGWVLIEYYKGYNFSDYGNKSLHKLIPERRDATADELAKQLYELAQNIEEDLDRMAKILL